MRTRPVGPFARAARSALPLVVVLVAVAMVAAGCGSRTSEKSADPTETTQGGGDTTAASNGDEGSPCGPGDASGATDKGVTDDTIRIATIQDIAGPAPGLFQGNLDAMNAFVAYCNSLGGINGRQLELVPLDSKLLAYADAARQACSEDVFAVVGTGAALDGNGTVELEACGIPDIPAFTAEPAHRGAKNMFQPLPNPPGFLAVGVQRYIAKTYPEIIKKGALIYSDRQTTRDTAQERKAAFEPLGFEFIYEATVSDLADETALGPVVAAMKEKGVKYYNFVGAPSVSATLRKVLQSQGMSDVRGDGDQSAYDSEGFLKPAGSAGDGMGMTVTTVPFEEAETSPELQKELEWLDKSGAVAAPSALGVQGWSAGLLFATAAKAAGSDLTRANLLAELEKITEWDGNGIHAPAGPGIQQGARCFVYMVVKDGKYTREYPDEGFACDEKNAIDG